MYSEGKECLNPPVRARKGLTESYFLRHLESRSWSHEGRIVCTKMAVILKSFKIRNNIR